MSVATELRAAANRIRKHGWTRGKFRKGSRYCMQAALMASGPHYCEANRLLRYVCDSHPAHFNDQECRSRNDAIAALEIAADLAT